MPTPATTSIGTPTTVNTVVHRYRPWDSDQVSADIRVATRSKGICRSSIASDRSDAVRCFFGNTVADPCFVDPGNANKAVCPMEDPDDVTLVTQDVKAAAAPSNSGGDAWLARTTGGISCRAYTGAGSVTDNVRNWGCAGGELTMAQKQSTNTWTGLFTPNNAKKSTKVSMAEVWT